jgi:CRP/FNR family transcriptional regulator, cyclic AMP receptor protein
MDAKPTETARILHYLQSLSLFDDTSQSSLIGVARVSRLKKLPRGRLLFRQGDPADAVYLLRRGAVALRLESLDGRELVISDMLPEDCLGELGALTGQPRSASAEAIVDSEVVMIPRDAFLGLFAQAPTLTLRLLEITAARLQNSSRLQEALAFHDAQERLARQLLHLDRLASDQGYLTISQEELAQRTGLTRQTVAEILGRWRRNGWLLTGRGHIVLLNRSELELLDTQLELED